MADEKTIDVTLEDKAPAKSAEPAVNAVAEIAKSAAEAAPKAANKVVGAAKKTARKAKRAPQAIKTARAAKAVKRAAVKAPRKIKQAVAPKRVATERTIAVTNYDFFKGFDALPGFAPFQDMMTKANENGQQFAQRGQKVAEELADLARANVEAMVEAGRVASEGAKALGQDAVSTSRDGFEKAADAIRTLAEAKSPTEYLQLQGEFARASFDRMVAEGSKLTETMVKLAGEAFQPIQNRAAKNAERFNTLVA